MEDTSISIKVDIDELESKLIAMKEDDFVTVELILKSDGYDTEMQISAVSIEEEENVSYGTLECLGDDFF